MAETSQLAMPQIPSEKPASGSTSINGHLPIFRLPRELLEGIVGYLCAREAIYLSLTCRDFYHGVLSAENHLIWFTLGNFKYTIPGKSWDTDGYQQLLMMRKRGKVFCGDGSIAYRKMLVETMLGITASGCQWCLKKPRAMDMVAQLNMRLCHACLEAGKIVLPLDESDFQSLPIDCAARKVFSHPLFYALGGNTFNWGPRLARIVRQTYGLDKTLQSFIEDLKAERFKQVAEREQKLHLYRNERRREFWDFMFNHYTTCPQSIDKFLVSIRRIIPPEQLRVDFFMPPIVQDLKDYEGPSIYTIEGLFEIRNRWEWETKLCSYEEMDPALRLWDMNQTTLTKSWLRRNMKATLKTFKFILAENENEDIMGFPNNFTKAHKQRMFASVTKLAVAYYRNLYEEESKPLFAQEQGPSGSGIRGLVCPATGLVNQCERPRNCFPDLASYIEHACVFHSSLVFIGNLDWLIGRASKCWFGTAMNIYSPNPVGEERIVICEEQKKWLEKWWPEGRWRQMVREVIPAPPQDEVDVSAQMVCNLHLG